MTKISNYGEFFRRATGETPLPYQCRLATEDRWPARIEVPTGLGKTLAVVVAWLWRRRHPQFATTTPRRLVYCLPMRVLVEQSRDVVLAVLRRLEAETRVTVLMGGVEDSGDWDTAPCDDAIILGTQDMLLSRALNRGYGMSRYRWPLHFGLLNTDCLWVIDEVQLVGSGVATTAQLQALRRKLGTHLPTQTTWMSATLDERWLQTVDVEAEDVAGHLMLDAADRANAVVASRLGAIKACSRASTPMGDAVGLAREVLSSHRSGSRTLVIVNTVARAQELFTQLQKKKPAARLVLLHSRFRAPDRRIALEHALAAPPPEGTILVSTQVIEAGVDLSSSTLFTELAPWASMVQRFGRCNRRGELSDARVFWLGLPEKRGKLDLPYSADALDDSAGVLSELHEVGPAALPRRELALETGLVLRRRDLLDLFDTTPDLMGNDVDVSRFIRDADDHDLRVCWRDFSDEPNSRDPSPARDELCAVSIAVVRDWQKSGREMWCWNGVAGNWEPVQRIYPGLTLLLRAADGGYDLATGLQPKSRTPVVAVPTVETSKDEDRQYDGDPESELGRWYGLSEHSADVSAESAFLSTTLGLPQETVELLATAGRWHDLGKAHPVWQDAAKKLGVNPPTDFIAKSQSERGRIRFERRGFRHELASALASLQHGLSDLAAYLVASHHGKVRMSLRALPKERPPTRGGEPAPEVRFARGVWEGDVLPSVDLGGGVQVPETTLTLSYMELGLDPQTGPSWAERMLALRDSPTLGPFRMGFLEALVKCADERASARISAKKGAS